MRHGLGLQVLDRLATLAEDLVFPGVQLAAEVLPLPLIHKRLALRRLVAGWKLGTHAHSLRLERVIKGRGYSDAPRPVNLISLTQLPRGLERGHRQHGSHGSPAPVDQGGERCQDRVNGQRHMGLGEAGGRRGAEIGVDLQRRQHRDEAP